MKETKQWQPREGVHQLHLNVPVSLANKLARHAVETNQTQTQIIVRLLEKELKGVQA